MIASSPMRLFAILSLTLFLAGCTVFSKTVSIMVNEKDNYLDAQELEKLEIPPDLEGGRIADIWEIPDIETIPAAKYYATKAPRPLSIVGDSDPDLIRIQKLGERSWMVLQRKPDTVWPLVRQFLTFNGVEVAEEQPNSGVIVTHPLNISKPDRTSLLHATVRTENPEAKDNDFLVFRVEQGMRRGSSEVHLKYLANERELQYVDWSLPSKQPELSNTILRQLAQFEVDDIGDQAVSRIGQAVASEPKIELIRDDNGFPILRFNVDFERTWATVLTALERGPYGIGQSERESKVIDLDIDSRKLDRTQRRVLGELLEEIQRRARSETPIVIRLQVSPLDQVNEIKPSRTDGEDLTLELAEHFLVMIQQFAS